MPRKKTVKKPYAPRKKSAAKGTGKRASSVKVVEDVSLKKNSSGNEAKIILLFAVSVLLGCIVLIKGVNVWRSTHEFLLALFGPCAFLIPPVLIYIAVLSALKKNRTSLSAKIGEAMTLIVLLSAAVHLFTIKTFPSFAELYAWGIQLSCGGVMGGIVGAPLYYLCGKTGAVIIVFLLIFVFVMLTSGITLYQLLVFLIPALRKKENGEKQDKSAPEPVHFRHKKPKFNIDIPIDEKEDELSGQTGNCNDDAGKASAGGILPKPHLKKQDTSALDALVSKIATLNEPGDDGPSPIEQPAFKNEKAEQMELYNYPPHTLLRQEIPSSNEDISEELKSNAARLVDTLRSFGVETRIINISRGPAVTRYELQPSAGVKISRITSLSDDIALNLAAAGVRIEAPIPNKAAVGIEVPNKVVSIVNIREIIDSKEFRDARSKLTVALGRDIAGNAAVTDIAKMPHVLIAGATGSGKSVCINSIIISLLYKASPQEVRFLMVDPKVVELGVYNGIPHLLVPVVTDPRKAAGALNWAVAEMLKRYRQFADNNVRDIRGFNELARHDDQLTPMPQIVIIIDELADLMMAAPNDVEDAICRLAQMARAAGMHLVIATQRPSVDVITGIIKANIPSRIAFSVSSQVDSRTILDMGGAEKLLGRGDMLFLPVGASKPVRIQGCFVSDNEVESVIDFVKNSSSSEYSEEIMDEIEKQAVKDGKGSDGTDDAGDADAMLNQAIECVIEAGMASTSLLQRRLKLGYARAARIIDQLEARGIVGPFEGSKPRQVLMTRQQYMEMSLNSKE